MNIGEVKSVRGQLIGSIATMTIDLPRIGFKPVDSNNDKAPVFDIIALNVAKRWVRVGALWEAVANGTGEVFLQGYIEDPSLPQRLPIACFGSDEEGYRIAWNRPRSNEMGRSERRSRSSDSDFGESTVDEKGQLAAAGDLEDSVLF